MCSCLPWMISSPKEQRWLAIQIEPFLGQAPLSWFCCQVANHFFDVKTTAFGEEMCHHPPICSCATVRHVLDCLIGGVVCALTREAYKLS